MPTTEGTVQMGNLLDHMGDESVCELLEVGLGMLARARLGEGVRATAQSCVQNIVTSAFRRLKGLQKEDVDKLLEDAKHHEEKIKLSSKKIESVGQKEEHPDAKQEKQDEMITESEEKPTEPQVNTPMFTPYGLPTILELLRVLIALLDPNDQAHTDSMRFSALAILNTALEVGGLGLGNWPELREGVTDEGCKYLFQVCFPLNLFAAPLTMAQLTRADSPSLLAQSLRTTSTLFSTLLPHLRPQLELFLSYLIDRLTPSNPAPLPPQFLNLRSDSRPSTPSVKTEGRVTPVADASTIESSSPASTPKPVSLLPPVPNETRELMLDSLTQVALRPSFMVDCWVNFDCSTDSEDLFERLIAFLTRGVYPHGPPKSDGSSHFFEGLDSTQLLSLEILLAFVSSMADRLEQGDETWPSEAPTTASLKEAKGRKAVILTGAALFNTKPKNGLSFLEEKGIIVPDPADEGTDEEKRHLAIARFLRHCSRLDKKLLGEFISRPDQLGLLKAYIGLFNFSGKSVADAMRELLETFRLPGEAQPIARITETFAEHFFSFSPPEIADQDAVYVLAYSVIMLNTDLHNPQNRVCLSTIPYLSMVLTSEIETHDS